MNSQKKTLISQMTIIAMMAVLQLLFLFAYQFYPLIGYWLTLLLPFFTLLTLVHTELKGFIIYLITSLLLIFFFLAAPFEIIMFYWFPGFSLGIGYAFAIKKKVLAI
jgi:hypothetical protein